MIWTPSKMVSMELSISGKAFYSSCIALTSADDQCRPSPNRQNPFAAISQNEEDQKAMKEAERNPVSVMLSDWDHMYSSDYMKALHDTGYDILYATIFIPTDNQSLTETSCTDSILIGGKGSIYCKDPEELTALQPKKVQDVVNATLTDKG